MNKKLITIIIILLVLIFILLGIYFFLLVRNRDSEVADDELATQSPSLIPPSGELPPRFELQNSLNFKQQLPPESGGGRFEHQDRASAPSSSTKPSQSSTSGSSVVKTDAGDRYGIDIEGLVRFLNSNSTVRKVLKGYSSVNLVVQTGTESVELVAYISSNGTVSEVSDGSSSSAAFTITFPLEDLQEVINNYENLNLLSVWSLLSKTEISPESAKSELLKKVLGK